MGRLSEELPGTWELISRVETTAANERRVDPGLGEDPIAMLIYDRSGHFAVQFMKRHRPGVGSGTSPAGGYDAYFGTYTVDDEARTVSQHLVGALSPEHVGHALSRGMTVEGDSLVIRLQTTASDGLPVTRTLTWRRVG